MTTATESITEYTQAQIAHRRACAFLKGLLCGHADKCGHKYETTKERTPEFDAGFKAGQDGWASREAITTTHILHNRLRHRPPHTGTVEGDAGYCHPWPKRQLKDYLGAELMAELEVLNG
jgi:hypothetical protein